MANLLSRLAGRGPASGASPSARCDHDERLAVADEGTTESDVTGAAEHQAPCALSAEEEGRGLAPRTNGDASAAATVTPEGGRDSRSAGQVKPVKPGRARVADGVARDSLAWSSLWKELDSYLRTVLRWSEGVADAASKEALVNATVDAFLQGAETPQLLPLQTDSAGDQSAVSLSDTPSEATSLLHRTVLENCQLSSALRQARLEKERLELCVEQCRKQVRRFTVVPPGGSSRCGCCRSPCIFHGTL